MLQIVGFSLLIIGVLIALAALGVLGLATVVVVHESAEVLVILHAVRAARARALPGLTAAPIGDGRHHLTVATTPPPDDPSCAPALHQEGCACCAPDRSGTPDRSSGRG